jgi:hypothetical protein
MSYLVDKAVLSGRQTFGHDGRGRDTNYTRLGRPWHWVYFLTDL